MKTVDLYEYESVKDRLGVRGIVKRLAIVAACAVLVIGGIRLYVWAWPRIHYALLDRQEWRADMEPWEYFPPVPPDAKEPPARMNIERHSEPLFGNPLIPERIDGMLESGELLDMRGFEPGGTIRYSRGHLNTLTLFWRKDGGGMILLEASPVDRSRKRFTPTETLEMVRRPLITCRDGVDIICAGGKDEEKCIRFYKDGVWLQICGDVKISYEEMVRVAEYYFVEPLDFY